MRTVDNIHVEHEYAGDYLYRASHISGQAEFWFDLQNPEDRELIREYFDYGMALGGCLAEEVDQFVTGATVESVEWYPTVKDGCLVVVVEVDDWTTKWETDDDRAYEDYRDSEDAA